VTDPALLRPLALARELLDRFHDEGVRYCKWKSGRRSLERSLAGRSDLDLLIDRGQHAAAQGALTACGFKRLAATAGRGYPGVEDYFGLDAATGTLLHCHVHYRLIIGEPNLKSYRLPWEAAILGSRRLEPGARVYVPDPDLEILLLAVRLATRLHSSDRFVHAPRRSPLGGEATVEHDELRQRIDPTRSSAYCRTLLGAHAVPSFEQLLVGPLTLRGILRFRAAAQPALRRYRRYGAMVGLLRTWLRASARLAAGVSRRYPRIPLPLRRTVPWGGVMVAFVGPDGSGKSTLARNVVSVLADKLDVYFVYFGSGDGPSSLVRWPLLAARRALKRVGLRPRREPAGLGAPAEPGPARRGVFWVAARLAWSLALSLEKRWKLRAAWRARNRGMVVITDRYPQAQVLGFNDGPLLGAWNGRRGGLLHWLAEWEAAPYEWADRHPPDLIVKLNVSPQAALRRKPETGVSEVERRLRAIHTLAYPPPAAVAEVDADRPLPDVSLDVKRLVWDRI